MTTVVEKQPSKQHSSKVIEYIPHYVLINRINDAIKAFEDLPNLSDDRVGRTIKTIASHFELARDVNSKPRNHPGIDFHKTLRRAEHELSGLSGLFLGKATGVNSVATQALEIFTKALQGSAYDIT